MIWRTFITSLLLLTYTLVLVHDWLPHHHTHEHDHEGIGHHHHEDQANKSDDLDWTSHTHGAVQTGFVYVAAAKNDHVQVTTPEISENCLFTFQVSSVRWVSRTAWLTYACAKAPPPAFSSLLLRAPPFAFSSSC